MTFDDNVYVAQALTTPPIGEGTCPDQWYEYGNHCYFFETVTATWTDANAQVNFLRNEVLNVNVIATSALQFI